MKKYLELSWKRILIIIAIWIASVILHNAFSAILKIEEGFFFTIAVIIIPLYVITAIVYTIYKKVKK